MMPLPTRGLGNLKKYEKDCEDYNDIIEMFKELGSGTLERRIVLKNIKTMIANGLVDKLETIIDDIELYEEWN